MISEGDICILDIFMILPCDHFEWLPEVQITYTYTNIHIHMCTMLTMSMLLEAGSAYANIHVQTYTL